MARDRYLEQKSRTSLIKFGLIGGIEADTDPARVRVLDSNNVFPSPNGTEAGPRPGCEIRKRYRVTTNPVGRKAIVIETAPPDVSLGNLIMVINTENGRNAIEAGAFVRDRSQLPLQSASAAVYFEFGNVSTDPGLTIQAPVLREGNQAIAGTVDYATRDGSAIAGVDYTAQSGTLPFNAYSDEALLSLTGTGLGSEGKFFFVDLSNPSNGFAINQFQTLIVTVNG